MPDFVKNYVMLGMAILIAVLGLAAFEYKRLYKATDFALKTQNKAIDAQNKLAGEKLERLTRERDTAQDALNKRAEAQGKTDEANKQAVDKAGADLQRALVAGRLRVAGTCRPSGGSPAGQVAASAASGTGDRPEEAGLLPAGVSSRLIRLVAEADRINAAYASCRADAYSVRGDVNNPTNVTPDMTLRTE